MDIWTAFDQVSEFFQTFSPFAFNTWLTFFDPDYDGILSYWPFFLAAALFIFFGLLKGIINLINDL